MAKKKTQIPKYGTITLKGIQYYRTRITDADGKELSLYAATCEELYEKQLEARKQVEEIIFHRQHPTVAEYGEKWLLMQSAKVSASTLRGYTRDMTNYIIKPLGEMYMEEVTADDIRLALVPLSKKSEGLYNKASKPPVARLSSLSANLLKIPETQGSRGFFLCEDMPLFAAEGRKGLGLLRGFLRLPSCFQVTNEVTRRVFSKSKMQHKERRILSNASFFMPK